jgi:hypothetical protein
METNTDIQVGIFIQAGLLLMAIIAVISSQWSDRKQRKLQMYADYTRRYQDIFMKMPDDIYDGAAAIDERTKKYMRFYFNLCSEEYHLWKDKNMKNDVWEMWVEGMQIETEREIFHKAWDVIKKEYNPDFRDYFEENVINRKYEEK